MSNGTTVTADRVEGPSLWNCDQEPIRIPGQVQPHGLLFVLTGNNFIVSQVSENVHHYLKVKPADALGQPISELLGQDFATVLAARLATINAPARPVLIKILQTRIGGREQTFHCVAHRADNAVLLELEAATDAAPAITALEVREVIDAFALNAEESTNAAEICRSTAQIIRHLTDYDRVMLYQFDDDWNGLVVGEDSNGRLPSYLHHRFPASDIPAQARELYRLNRMRLIPDASYAPVPLRPALNPETGKPLDMTFASLRSVSPIHVEYMKNMKTWSSMSISIIVGSKLWGLICCHHTTAKHVAPSVREVCELVARVVSLRLSALSNAVDYERRIQVRSAFSRLLEEMTDRGNFSTALTGKAEELQGFVNAEGAAILQDDHCARVGRTPSEEQVRDLARWLFNDVKQDVFSTDALAEKYPPAAAFADRASGVLAVAVSKIHPSYILWFRPEVVQSIQWAGNPHKSADPENPARLHPRLSFDTWMETVRQRSLPWSSREVEGAGDLRNAIVGIVLRKAEELAELNAELNRSNKELEAFSYSVSHDLRAPLRHIVGYGEMLNELGGDKLNDKEKRCITTIIESSEYAGRLVDKLLNYSRLGRAELQSFKIDMNMLVSDSIKFVMRDAGARRISWTVGKLPFAMGDLMMLQMAVRDLLSNALKYTRGRDEAKIDVGSRHEGGENVFWVKDNGVGFDMKYAGKLFGVFQRLHRWEDFEGTGIGLANVRRVIERHRGRTWAEGQEDVGATFFFSLPRAD